MPTWQVGWSRIVLPDISINVSRRRTGREGPQQSGLRFILEVHVLPRGSVSNALRPSRVQSMCKREACKQTPYALRGKCCRCVDGRPWKRTKLDKGSAMAAGGRGTATARITAHPAETGTDNEEPPRAAKSCTAHPDLTANQASDCPTANSSSADSTTSNSADAPTHFQVVSCGAAQLDTEGG